MGKGEPYRRWSSYFKNLVIWFLVTAGVSVAAVLGIFRGIFVVMDHFLANDRFYEGVAASAGISACGVLVLFVAVFVFIRKASRYPRRKFRALRGI